MYLSAYARMYADLCRALRRHSRLRLNSSLCRDPYREPYPTLNRASFRKPFEKPNPVLFRSLWGFAYLSLFVRANLAPDREIWPPGRPVGRWVGRRIVSCAATDHYI